MDETVMSGGLQTVVSGGLQTGLPDCLQTGLSDGLQIAVSVKPAASPPVAICGACDDAETGGDQPTPTPPGSAPAADFIVGRSVKARVLELINRGSFGTIHRGVMLETGEEVVVKLEKQKAPCPQLLAEADIYRHLQGGPGIPKFFWGGLYDYEPFYNVLVIELLGPSIQDLFAYCHHRFSLKTVLMLADQMVDIMRFIHEKRYIYRDIKPDNFLIGVGADTRHIYVVDFGLAKKYERGRTLRRSSSYHFCHSMVGTTRYASLHAHRGEEQSPRDDMESLAYVWLYLLRGNLPWQGIKAEHKDETFAAVKEAKLSTTSERLCEGLPAEFASYLDYAKRMKMDEMPNYKKIKAKFRALAEVEGIEYDWEYDWNVQQAKTGVEFRARGLSDHGHESS